jgi:hypothetical protein
LDAGGRVAVRTITTVNALEDITPMRSIAVYLGGSKFE